MQLEEDSYFPKLVLASTFLRYQTWFSPGRLLKKKTYIT